MADRKRSQDGSRDTDAFVTDDKLDGQQGRQGGDLQKDVATQDEEKRAKEKPAGVTRVTGEDERKHGEDG